MAEFDRVVLEYINSIDLIEVDYSTPITNIEITIGQNVQTVYSVNGLYGDIALSASAELSLTTTSAGYYDHIFNHSLNYKNVQISVFDTSDLLVFADVITESPTYAIIRSPMDLTGYKAVAQR